jgi:hypothetical protein
MALALRNRADTTAKIQRQATTLRSAIDDDRKVAAKSRQLAAARDVLLDDLAEQEARGAISREDVDERLATADREASAHVRNAEARERAADVRERELEALEREVVQADVDGKLADLAALVKAQDVATAAAKRTIHAAAKAATALVETRKAAAALRADLEREFAGVDVAWPAAAEDLKLVDGCWTTLVANNSTLYEALPAGDPALLANGRASLVNRVYFRDDLLSLVRLLAG